MSIRPNEPSDLKTLALMVLGAGLFVTTGGALLAFAAGISEFYLLAALAGLFVFVLVGLGFAYFIASRNRARRAAGKAVRDMRESKELFRATLETVPTPLLIVSTSQQMVLAFNHRASEFFGMSEKQLGFRFAADFYESPGEAAKLEERVRTEGLVTDFETRLRTASGQFRWARLSANPTQFKGQRTLLIAIHDITRRKLAEHGYIEAKRLVGALIKKSPLPIFAVDSRHRLTRWNPAAEKLLGWSAEEIIGADIHFVEHNLPPRLLTAPAGAHGAELRRKGGAALTLNLSTERINDAAGNASEVLLLASDANETGDSEARLNAICDATQDAVLLLSEHGLIESVNASACRMFGLSDSEACGQLIDALVTLPRERGEHVTRALKADAPWIEREAVGRKKGGGAFPAELSVSAMNSGSSHRYTLVVRDISRRTHAEDLLRQIEARFSALTENASEVIVVVQENGAVSYASPSLARVLGYNAQDFIGKSAFDYIHFEDLGSVQAALSSINNKPGAKAVVEFRFRHADGAWRVLEAVGKNCVDNPSVSGIVLNSRDVTERRLTEQRATYLAQHDSLTGLPNRNLLHDRIQRALVAAGRSHTRVGILFIDLDRFKTINDSLGHQIGDRLLQAVAQRVLSCVREGDTVARQGGDEFVVVLPGVNDAEDTARVAQKILDALPQSFRIEQQDFHITSSIGICLYPDDGSDVETLKRHADTAMYQAKESGRNTYRFFTGRMNEAAQERLLLENNLRRAVRQKEFKLFYQSQIDLASGSIVGVEALVRWQHPEKGLVAPSDFIPIAEETGLIVNLGEWVLHEACREARGWQVAGLPAVKVTVNLSARQFREKDLLGTVRGALTASELDPRFLELELTESVVMEDADATITTLEELNELGVALAIDDFGTGYSSLSYLKRFPIDKLKIDQSFVRDVTNDPNDAAIASAIIALARSLKVKVIAEGVETFEQLAFLREHGCEEGQGYYFAKPVPGYEFTQFLEEKVRASAA
ncbi:MAG TPA: EAL domain-containing protein [Burkholderiales bacterium]|nr:EAL domain-containing protein [Burkholderiales bacterium]